MEYTYQISTGGFYEQSLNSEVSPAHALRAAYNITGAGDVIIGCNTQADYYRKILNIVHSAGKRCWFWLPVFSELPDNAAPEYSVRIGGELQQGLSIIPGENFRFVCPSSQHNLNIAYEVYVKHFADMPFDGVFLDKIRHGSFAGGLTEGFGCFCESCRETYAKRGVNLDEISEMIRHNPAAFLPDSLNDAAPGVKKYGFADATVMNFYSAKAGIITDAVAQLSDKFTKLGLQTALDVFVPMFAFLVGQDIPTLSKYASFTKPMCYRITHAPAGIPYELSGLRESFLPYGVDAEALLKKLWHTEDVCSLSCLEGQLNEHTSCAIRPGFEINFVQGICESSAAYVRETAELLKRSSIENAALCWNLLSAGTDANLQALSGSR